MRSKVSDSLSDTPTIHFIFIIHICQMSSIELMTKEGCKDRTGQDRTGQDRTGQDRTGQDRTVLPRHGTVRYLPENPLGYCSAMNFVP